MSNSRTSDLLILLNLALSGLEDLSNGWPHKEISAVNGSGLDTLIVEIKQALAALGYVDEPLAEGMHDAAGSIRVATVRALKQAGLTLDEVGSAFAIEGDPIAAQRDTALRLLRSVRTDVESLRAPGTQTFYGEAMIGDDEVGLYWPNLAIQSDQILQFLDALGAEPETFAARPRSFAAVG